MQLYSCVVMACATNLYTIRINSDFYIILGQKYGLPFQNCGMYAETTPPTLLRLHFPVRYKLSG